MKIAMTASTSFLGREIIRQFKDHELVLLVRTATDDPRSQVVDFKNTDSLKEAMKDCDLLLHCIGAANGSEAMLEEVNVTLTENLMKALPESVKKVVYLSSAAAAMRKGPYGEAKLRAETLVKESGRDWVLLRPTMIYGPGDNKNLALMVDWVTQKMFVPILGGGNFKVQPVHVEDVAAACIQACLRDGANEQTLNLCGPEQVSLRHMLYRLKELTKSKCIFVSVPLKPVQFVLGLWLAIYPKTTLPVKQVKELDKHEAFEFTETQRLLDYNPRKFDDGLDWLS